MKIPVIQQMQRSDFPDAPAWITKLLYPLQLFMTTVVSALTSQLTFQDNFSCAINQVTITAGATSDLNTVSFQWPFGRQPIELTIHVTRTDGTYEEVYPEASWNMINQMIVVNGIKGLTATKQYNLTFVVK